MTTINDDRTIRDLVARIDELGRIREQAEAVAKSLKAREGELRELLLETMQGHDIRHARVGDINVIVRSVRRTEITDEEALRAATEAAGVGADYLVFDRARASKDAIANEWPGVSLRTQEQLVVSSGKAVKA